MWRVLFTIVFFRKRKKTLTIPLTFWKCKHNMKRSTFWKWKLIPKPILKMKTCFQGYLQIRVPQCHQNNIFQSNAHNLDNDAQYLRLSYHSKEYIYNRASWIRNNQMLYKLWLESKKEGYGRYFQVFWINA